eukprot:1696436-Amphidinium_carterae.1
MAHEASGCTPSNCTSLCGLLTPCACIQFPRFPAPSCFSETCSGTQRPNLKTKLRAVEKKTVSGPEDSFGHGTKVARKELGSKHVFRFKIPALLATVLFVQDTRLHRERRPTQQASFTATSIAEECNAFQLPCAQLLTAEDVNKTQAMKDDFEKATRDFRRWSNRKAASKMREWD